jgi:hypothetical protein
LRGRHTHFGLIEFCCCCCYCCLQCDAKSVHPSVVLPQSGTEPARLLAWHCGPLLALLLLEHGAPRAPAELAAGLRALLAAPGSALSAQLGAELPPRHLWHVKGLRYLYQDQLAGAVRCVFLSPPPHTVRHMVQSGQLGNGQLLTITLFLFSYHCNYRAPASAGHRRCARLARWRRPRWCSRLTRAAGRHWRSQQRQIPVLPRWGPTVRWPGQHGHQPGSGSHLLLVALRPMSSCWRAAAMTAGSQCGRAQLVVC